MLYLKKQTNLSLNLSSYIILNPICVTVTNFQASHQPLSASQMAPLSLSSLVASPRKNVLFVRPAICLSSRELCAKSARYGGKGWSVRVLHVYIYFSRWFNHFHSCRSGTFTLLVFVLAINVFSIISLRKVQITIGGPSFNTALC